MDVDLALLADAATIDGSGKLNILGIFDRVSTAAFPTRHPRMSLILRFSAAVNEVGAHQIDIRLKAPDGSEVMRIDGEMNLAAGPMSVGGAVLVPHILNMDGLVFPRPGRYAFDVTVDGQHQVSIPLNVDGPESTVQA